MGAVCCAPAPLVALLLLWGLCWASGPELLHPRPAVYEGPPGSYFGFSLDFYVTKNRTRVAVGAPRANTSQPGVVEPGAVFLCSWPGKSSCDPVPFDTVGACTLRDGARQWLGASVTSWHGTLVACAPLQHWNAIQDNLEAFRTPVGACFMGAEGLHRFIWYSPCRSTQMAPILDQRYCELGFSAAVTSVRRGARGATGMVPGMLVGMSPGIPPGMLLGLVMGMVPRGCPQSLGGDSPALHPTHPGDGGVTGAHLPAGYSVAVGEFDDNSKTKGKAGPPAPGFCAPLCSGYHPLPPLSQVASYFGHTVAVADINGDGGVPEGKLSEVGRLYLYLQRGQWSFAKPPQTLTGTHPYGRFASAIASLGDLDKDGYGDVAVGAPFGGDSSSGQVLIFRGQREGLEPVPTQRLDSPFPGPAAFGFALRGATDLDGNGYMDLLVGAFGDDKVAVYCSVVGTPVTGQNISQSIRKYLDAELQLDRLKPKLSRRVLLLQGHQTFLAPDAGRVGDHLPRACGAIARCCPQDKADFKDKLSPIVTSLSLALASSSDARGLGLVLYGDTLVQAQTHIVLEDCGEDNVCVPDLRLTAHTPGTHLLIGAENVVSLRAQATNAGEGAFEAELRVQLPEDTYYQKALSNIQGQEKLSCIPRKENGSRVVLCELGNPMKAGAQVWAVGHPLPPLPPAGGGAVSPCPLSPPHVPAARTAPPAQVVTVVVPVEAQAAMELRGWHGAEGSRRLEDHGIRVEHVYQVGYSTQGCHLRPRVTHCHLPVLPQLHNKGPATVTNVTLRLDVPTEIDGRILFYLLELGTEGGISCTQPPGLNPKQLEMPQPTGVGPHNKTHRRERREADEPVAPALEKPVPVVSGCSPWDCSATGTLGTGLAKDQRVLVSVRALLWMDTLQQHLLKQFLVQSRGFFNTSAMPYRVQPHVLPSGEAEVQLSRPDGKRDVPVWWVVLGILAGILLLTLLILLMWKIGFFKRTRPPVEEDTQELAPGQAQEMGGTQS
uniref:Integrin subunit alpha 2b n=1 Tax=Anas platyrhynchos TaxID=8839 RepID=A0A8B9T715_ANAPL